MTQMQEEISELKAIVRAGLDHYNKECNREPGYTESIVVPKLKAIAIDICRNIEKSHALEGTEDQNRSLVTHYTSISALFTMLQDAAEGKNSSLRLYDSVHFNDPNEGQILVSYLERRHDWLKLERRHPSLAYVASFVEPRTNEGMDSSHNELVFWLVYGRECEGCSLRLSIPNSRLRKVSYFADEATRAGQALIPVLDTIEPLANIDNNIREILAKGFFESLEGIQYLYKNQRYKFENECRFLISDSNVPNESICFQFSNEAPVIVRHYWEHEELSIDKIFGSGSSITIGSRVPDFDDLERTLKTLIDRINARLHKHERDPISPSIRLSEIQHRKI